MQLDFPKLYSAKAERVKMIIRLCFNPFHFVQWEGLFFYRLNKIFDNPKQKETHPDFAYTGKEGFKLLEIYKTIDEQLKSLDKIEEGSWVNLINPTEEEVTWVCKDLGLDSDAVRAALDEEERSRLELEDDYTLILVDIPVAELKESAYGYTTLPLGIIHTDKCIMTVCLRENSIIRGFQENRVKTFYTFKKTRFILQILYRNATQYLQYLKRIDKESNRIESRLHRSTKNQELIQLLNLEKSLVFFSTSLRTNEVVLEKLLRTDRVKNYPEDTDLLEDVIIENKQAIEMARIYSDILSGTMDAFASVISNNLNIVMKFLTSVTIVMAIPTMISSFWGMNVSVPLHDNPMAFPIIFGIAAVLCVLAAVYMAKRKMF